MNWDRIEGKWRRVQGKVRTRWGKLTDGDLEVIAGKRDQLVGRLQERYGWARDQVEDAVRDFQEHLQESDLEATAPPDRAHTSPGDSDVGRKPTG